MYVFAIDISPMAVESGYTNAAIQAVAACLQLLPRGNDVSSATRVGIMTFHTSLQFYSFRPLGKQNDSKTARKRATSQHSKGDSSSANYLLPVISIHECEISEPFPPIPADRWLLSLADYSLHFETLLHHISISFSTSLAPSNGHLYAAPMAAVRACHMALQESMSPLATETYVPPKPVTATTTPKPTGMFDFWSSKSPDTATTPEPTPLVAMGPPPKPKKCASRGGKIYCLSACSPSCGYGAVSCRENTANYGKIDEFIMYGRLAHVTQYTVEEETKKVMNMYNDWIDQLVNDAVSVDVIMGVTEKDAYRETAIIGELCTRTGGSLVMMGGKAKSERFEEQLVHQITAVHGRDVYMKMRCSIGYCVDDYVGSGQYNSTTQVVALAHASTDNTSVFTLKCDVGLKDEEKVHVQLAVLFTNPQNHRVVRVHNLTFFATDSPYVIYRHIDTEALIVTIWKTALQLALTVTLASVHPKRGALEYIKYILSSGMHAYRVQCSIQTSSAQLIMPESLRLLPLFTLGMLKHPALLSNMSPSKVVRTHVRADERAFYLNHALSLNMNESILALHPKVYPLHQLMGSEGTCVTDYGGGHVTELPQCLHTSSIVFQSEGVYLLVDDGISWLYIGRNVPAQALHDWFGIRTYSEESVSRPKSEITFQKSNDLSSRMSAIVSAVGDKQSLKPGNITFCYVSQCIESVKAYLRLLGIRWVELL